MTGIFFETARERDDRIALAKAQKISAQPCVIDCDDAPVSTYETATEVQARLARAEQAAIARAVLSLDDRHAARITALRSMSDHADTVRMTDQLIDRLVEGSSPREARQLLCIVRNCVTQRMNALIIAEYDAEVAANPGADFAQLAGRDRGKIATSFIKSTRALLQARADGVQIVDQPHDMGGDPAITSVNGVAGHVHGGGPDQCALLVGRDASEG